MSNTSYEHYLEKYYDAKLDQEGGFFGGSTYMTAVSKIFDELDASLTGTTIDTKKHREKLIKFKRAFITDKEPKKINNTAEIFLKEIEGEIGELNKQQNDNKKKVGDLTTQLTAIDKEDKRKKAIRKSLSDQINLYEDLIKKNDKSLKNLESQKDKDKKKFEKYLKEAENITKLLERKMKERFMTLEDIKKDTSLQILEPIYNICNTLRSLNIEYDSVKQNVATELQSDYSNLIFNDNVALKLMEYFYKKNKGIKLRNGQTFVEKFFKPKFQTLFKVDNSFLSKVGNMLKEFNFDREEIEGKTTKCDNCLLRSKTYKEPYILYKDTIAKLRKIKDKKLRKEMISSLITSKGSAENAIKN